jgi:hypothetical protein
LGTTKAAAVEEEEDEAAAAARPAASGLGWMTGSGKDEAPPPRPLPAGPSKLVLSW